MNPSSVLASVVISVAVATKPIALTGTRAEAERLAATWVVAGWKKPLYPVPENLSQLRPFTPTARDSRCSAAFAEARQDHVTLVFNFFDELRRLVPDDR